MVGALDPPSVFIANLFENVVHRKEIAASAVANFFLLKLTNDASFYVAFHIASAVFYPQIIYNVEEIINVRTGFSSS